MTTAKTPRKLFRQHDELEVPMTNPLLRQLCEEWVSLHHSPIAAATIEAWAHDQDVFVGLTSPGGILDHIDAAEAAEKDSILGALLELTAQGDQLAGRIVQQAMLPCLTRLAARCRRPRGGSPQENLQRVLAEFWNVISRPRKLTTGIAGRLELDTLNGVTSYQRSHDAWEEHTYFNDAHHEDDDPANSAGDEHLSARVIELDPTMGGKPGPDASLVDVLVWLRRKGDLTAEDAQFCVEVYLSGDKDQKATALRLGMSHAAVRKRCSRLRARMAQAVAA